MDRTWDERCVGQCRREKEEEAERFTVQFSSGISISSEFKYDGKSG